MQAEFIQSNIDLKKHREVLKLKNAEEERKIEEYAVAKEKLQELKKKREGEIFAEKQMVKQRIIDRQVEYLKNLKNKEDQILDKQKKEAEEKKSREEEDKRKRFNLMKNQMDEHSAAMIRKKKDEKEREKIEDKQFVDFYKERMKELVF